MFLSKTHSLCHNFYCFKNSYFGKGIAVKLKRLFLQGFKSFKDRTAINFDQGITGIVGPNGCGKSNVVDALFWVMGEQSAKHLRGASMKDVIFSGSSKHSPAAWAEVTLVLENNEGKHIHIGPKVVAPSEIQLTRKLYRNGESEYRINDVPCRLKDIQEVFMDTGAGAKSYSIIAQGEINRLVQAKPEERRSMIEDVAGITKFKMRKRDSLRKIEQTELNLNRLVDLKLEIEKSLKLLEKQAEKAERARNLKEKVKKYELVVESHKEFEILKDFREGKQSLNESNLNIQNWILKKEQLEVSLEEERFKKDDETSRIDTLQSEFNKLSKELAGAEERLNYLAKTLNDKEKQVENREKELKEIEKDFNDRTVRLKQLEEDRMAFEGEEENGPDYSSLEEKVSELKEQLELQDSAFYEAEEEVKILKNKIQELEQRNYRNASRMEEYGAGLQDITQEIEVLEKQYSSVTVEMSSDRELVRNLEIQVEDLTKEEQKVRLSFDEKKKEIKLEEEKNKILTKELIRAESKLSSLKELQASLEGLKEGSKEILSKGKDEFALVGRLIQCDALYSKGVQRILGNMLDTLVSLDSEGEKKLLNEMSEEVTKGLDFLFCDKEIGEFSDEETKERLRLNGFKEVYSLSEILKIDLLAQNKLSPILAGHFIVSNESMEKYYDISSSINLKSLCSIDGNVLLKNMNGAKLVSVQNGDDCQGVIERNNRIMALEEELQIIKKDLDQSQNNLSLGSQLVFELEQKSEEARALYLKTKELFISKKTSVEARGTHLDSGNSRLEILKNRKNEISKSKLVLIEDQEKSSLELRERKEEFENKTSMRDDLFDSLSILRDTYSEEKENLIQKQVEAKSFHDRLKNFNSQFLDTQGQITRLGEKKENNLNLIKNIKNECQNLEEELLLLEQKNKESAGSLLEREEFLSDLKDKLSELLLSMQSREDEVKDLTRKIAKAEKDLVELEIKLAQHLIEEEQITKNIFEKYHVDLRVVLGHELSFLPEEYSWLNDISSVYQQETSDGPISILPVSYEFSRRYGQDLREAQIKFKDYKIELSRLGEVNWQAIEDYERQKLRFNFLAEQEGELKKSLQDLQMAINQIDEKSKIRFKTAFEEVNFRFQKVFPIMFGGGSAELKVTGHLDDPECGVEIIAQPPGKKMQNINLMSGGEKALTAVSLIFSIFLVRPSPFCLLDEVDAPLDDANVGRFNELLREMSQDSQFILITHNKKTMELNDTLYGITMQEPGVSKAVSVQLH